MILELFAPQLDNQLVKFLDYDIFTFELFFHVFVIFDQLLYTLQELCEAVVFLLILLTKGLLAQETSKRSFWAIQT